MPVVVGQVITNNDNFTVVPSDPLLQVSFQLQYHAQELPKTHHTYTTLFMQVYAVPATMQCNIVPHFAVPVVTLCKTF